MNLISAKLKTLLLIGVLIIFNPSFSQTKTRNIAQVYEVLNGYIDGRNEGDPDLLATVFHPESDLRYIKNDSLFSIWKSVDYIANVTPGKKQDCEARIVFVDVDGNAAQAKIEIEYANWQFVDYLNLLKLDGEWMIAVKSFGRERNDKRRVLFVMTSHEKLGSTDRKTGFHLGEVSHVYKPIHDAGFEIDFVSPKGGKTFMYGSNLNDSLNLWFVQNPSAFYHCTHAMTPDQVDPSLYSAIYFVGGHGAMWDFPEDTKLQQIARSIYENGGVVASVCHGAAGLVNLKLSSGDYLVEEKQVTAFSDQEEIASNQMEIVPFSLENKLRERNAHVNLAEEWRENVIVDERLVTGQNPQSAYKLAQMIISLLLI